MDSYGDYTKFTIYFRDGRVLTVKATDKNFETAYGSVKIVTEEQGELFIPMSNLDYVVINESKPLDFDYPDGYEEYKKYRMRKP
jgi:hypothetical protein